MERGRFIPLPEILPFIDSRTGQIIYLPKEKSPLLDFYNPSMSRSTSMSSISSLGSAKETGKPLPKPPINNKMYHPSRWKTELCRQFEEMGKCEYSDRCLYAHGKEELRPAAGRHPKYKTQLCRDFHGSGYCSFGSRCAFIHGDDSTGSGASSPATTKNNNLFTFPQIDLSTFRVSK